ncbi:MAG: hypothetical protein HYY24_03575 [Verrucomicrobia bacterium]|nr:hypothetical protein [Verrucomicrobiota bacterium]
MTSLSISEASTRLDELSERVRRNHQSVALTKGDEVIALLTPPEPGPAPLLRKPLTCGELAERITRRPRMPADEAEAFARDVEAAIQAGNSPNPEFEWPS